ncbi:MAG: radical SAM protein [Deltaproteobacteria bacterium]|nr:radical SAM protein [Deltaproteobacteria bacterium]
MSVHTDREWVFCIDRLQSGGVITNYFCTSRCAHCLYGCSPGWPRDYMNLDILVRVLEKIRDLGCRSVHIGGGEPFLDPEGLKAVVEATLAGGVDIEYVETNSSWYRDPHSARELLGELRGLGLRTLLVSMSPFHNEHIPFRKVKGVLEACRAAGMGVFPWIPEFYPEIDALDERIPHSLGEYEERYGGEYLGRIPSRYWVHFGGRAIGTFRRVLGSRPATEILAVNRGGCRELLNVGHFHFDLYGNYIPGLCSGLGIFCEDMGRPLDREKYPLLNTLFREGIGGLLDVASREYGYAPGSRYMSKCDLCLDIRRHLVLEKGIDSPELQPREFYGNL